MGAFATTDDANMRMGMPGRGGIFLGDFGQGGLNGSSSSNSQSTSNSGQSFAYPELAALFAGSMANPISQASQNYMDFVKNPTASPYFTNALQGLLGALQPSENAARLNLNDQFRAAGNTGSSTYGHNAMGLESELMRNRQATASNLLTTMFPQVAQAMFAPMGQANDLINALKMSQSSSQSTSSSQGANNLLSQLLGNGGGPQGISIQDSAPGFGNIFATPNTNTAAPTYGIQRPSGFGASPYISPDLTPGQGYGQYSDGWY